MKLRLIAVGRDKNEPALELAREYLERVRRYVPAELVELKEEPAKKNVPIDRVRAQEAARITGALAPGEWIVALDERGRALDSMELSEKLAGWKQGARRVALVIGGPNGLDRELLDRADERWALSRMTLPHRIARLVLAEQLYRACTILNGEPYHK